MKNNNDFEYKYVAPTSAERKEIEHIKNSYMPKSYSADKLARLRKLDGKVRNVPTMIALIFGIVGLLIFGTGLTLVLQWNLIVWGIVVGFVGVVPIALAYPMYIKVNNFLKNKYSEEIIKISDELLNDEE